MVPRLLLRLRVLRSMCVCMYVCIYFQTVILLNEENSPSVVEALECIAASDVLVASESKLSRAAVVLSEHVKVRRVLVVGLVRLASLLGRAFFFQRPSLSFDGCSSSR